jgi:hypothetical protein
MATWKPPTEKAVSGSLIYWTDPKIRIRLKKSLGLIQIRSRSKILNYRSRSEKDNLLQIRLDPEL